MSEEECKGSGKTREQVEKEDIYEREIVKGNTVNLNNIRVTDLPGNKEVILPSLWSLRCQRLFQTT